MRQPVPRILDGEAGTREGSDETNTRSVSCSGLCPWLLSSVRRAHIPVHRGSGPSPPLSCAPRRLWTFTQGLSMSLTKACPQCSPTAFMPPGGGCLRGGEGGMAQGRGSVCRQT